MSGICSTPSLAYEKSPSTHSATITMAAKTGLLIETRVIHMVGAPRLTSGPQARPSRREATGADLLATTSALAPSRRLSKRAASTWLSGRDALQHLDAALAIVAPAERDGTARQRAALDHPDMVLAGGVADRGEPAASAAAGRRPA